MPITKLTPDYTFTEDRLKELKQVVPEAFADGKINWDVLREALGEHLKDEKEEHFGLSWPGKRDARRLAARPSKGTLAPCPGEGVNEDTTENIFIEGENLEVMKILLKSYAGKIKMIYIDPPYNTGNDFIYNDNYSEPLEAYLRESGSLSEEGDLLTTNTRADGRFHSKWLNMMYPRLLIARNLLKEDGVIFISIDDNEIHNLRHVMNEIFGEENLVAQIPWQSRTSIQNDTDLSINHEYILTYAKTRRQHNRRLKESNEHEWHNENSYAVFPLPLDTSRFSNPDNDPRGPWKADPFDAPNIRPNLTYEIVNPNNGERYLPPNGRCWRTGEENFLELFQDGRIVFGKTGESRPQLKVFYEEKKSFGEIRNSWFSGDEYNTTTSGTKTIQELFDGNAVFDHPKPIKLISELIQMSGCTQNDIVLDFFAGSATTAHAILKMNQEDNEKRNFILVQIPEKSDHGSFQTIADLAKERIRRSIKKIIDDNSINVELSTQNKNNLGFRAFELTESNLFEWGEVEESDPQLALNLFSTFTDPLKSDWELDDLMTEVLLVEGFPLTSKIIPLEEINTNQVYRVSAATFCDHELFICFDKTIADSTLNLLPLKEKDIFICLDSALSDELKVRLEDQFNIHVI
jgi:adenine-specific DNA-methyltransferase